MNYARYIGLRQATNCIIMGSLRGPDSSGSQSNMSGSILVGYTLSILKTMPTTSGIIGNGLSYNSNSSNSVFICGQYNEETNYDSNDRLIVGCGTSTSVRANCFTTGNDGTNDYIKIGDTKLTEANLIALLATL